MPTLKMIRSMKREELEPLSKSLFWKRAAGGNLGHYWTDTRTTLCDRKLTSVYGYRGNWARKQCKVCVQRKKLIDNMMEEKERDQNRVD